jgi:hypothetical protein
VAKQKTEYNYENRVVAFVDILGFKDILSKTVDKDNNDVQLQIDRITDAYHSMRDVWDLDEELSNENPDLKKAYEEIKTNSKKVTTFSDSIVISFLQKEPSEIFSTLLELKWLIMRLISRGILCRGALAYGKMIHTDKFLFGPALVEAYETESKAALYPRIIVSRELIQMAGKARAEHHDSRTEIEYVMKLLKEDTDGMFYIDYFLGAQSELDDPENDFPSYINDVSEVIRKGVRSTRPDVKIKYMWMRDKVNKVIAIGKKEDWIIRLRNEGNDELANAYLALKKV